MKTLYRMGLVGLIACAPAGMTLAESAADTAVQVRSMTVKYQPGYAATEAGAKALYGKLRWAARKVCGDGGIASGSGLWAEQKCASSAVTDAVIAVNIPALDTVHGYRRGSVEVIASR